ncbi:MAG TPA: LysR substrate-binding domain-containing protein [Tianweitania sediminis]|nr:LysR substrate-binding domain-containing protein [Tianweitania sediminis]
MKPAAPLTYIRSFEASARHLSFTAAALELGYTQAAISSHVRALEKLIGRPLFVRYPRSLRLTEMGEAFLPTLRQALDQIQDATDAIIASAKNRTVVISAPISLAENWLPRCLAEFRRTYRDTELVLHGTVWEEADRTVPDITITVDRFDHRPADSVALWNDPLALLCAPSLAAELRSPSDLLQFDWIAVHSRQEYWRQFCEALDLDPARQRKSFTTNVSNIAMELAVAGAGCTAAQLSIAETYLQRGLLVEPFAVRPASPWTYYLVESARAKGPVVRVVRDWITNWAERYRSSPA